MSITILDFLGDILYPESLQNIENILTLCNESCVIFDSTQSRPINPSDLSLLTNGGRYHIRLSSDLQRGILIGLLYVKIPTIKLLTNRADLYSNYIKENCTGFNWSSSVKQETFSPKISNFFETVYNDSLAKYVKTILTENGIRANKIKSAKAQVKNLIDGIIISLNVKSGRREKIEAEEVVEAIFDDLLGNKIIESNITGNLEYNDQLIDAFFGPRKTMIFKPNFLRQNQEIRPEPDNAKNNLQFINIVKNSPTKNLENDYFRNISLAPVISQFESLAFSEKKQEKVINYEVYTDYVLVKVSDEIDKINSVLLLFRSCTKHLREFYEKNPVEESSKDAILKTVMKLILNTYFTADSSLSHEEIISDYVKNSNVKLIKND